MTEQNSRPQISKSNNQPTFDPNGGVRWRLSLGISRLLRTALFDLRIEAEGFERIPVGEPLIIAAGPHRNGMDAFLLMHCLPPVPRLYFLGSREAVANRPINRLVISGFGGLVPVSTGGGLNREALETALEILADGASLGIFPEGWDIRDLPPDQIMPLKRGVGYLAARSGRRVLPVGLAGTKELWRGKTLRLRFGSPLAAPADGSVREREAAMTAALARALEELRPPAPHEPPPWARPWRWLTHLVG